MRPLQAGLSLARQGPGVGQVPSWCPRSQQRAQCRGEEAVGRLGQQGESLPSPASGSQSQADMAGRAAGDPRALSLQLLWSRSQSNPAARDRPCLAQTHRPRPGVSGLGRGPGTHGGAVRRPGEEEPLEALGVLGVQAVEQVAGLLGVQERQHGPVIVLLPAAHRLPRRSQRELLWGQRPGEPKSHPHPRLDLQPLATPPTFPGAPSP